MLELCVLLDDVAFFSALITTILLEAFPAATFDLPQSKPDAPLRQAAGRSVSLDNLPFMD